MLSALHMASHLSETLQRYIVNVGYRQPQLPALNLDYCLSPSLDLVSSLALCDLRHMIISLSPHFLTCKMEIITTSPGVVMMIK